MRTANVKSWLAIVLVLALVLVFGCAAPSNTRPSAASVSPAAPAAPAAAAVPPSAAPAAGTKLTPEQIKEHEKRAQEFYRQKDYRKTLDEFQAILSFDPGNQSALYNAACAYSLLNEKDQAVAYLEKAVEAGWANFDAIQKDADLDGIRDTDGYKELLKTTLMTKQLDAKLQSGRQFLAKKGVDASRYRAEKDTRRPIVYLYDPNLPAAQCAAMRKKLEDYADFQWEHLFSHPPATPVCIILLDVKDLAKAACNAGARGEFMLEANMLYGLCRDTTELRNYNDSVLHEFTHLLHVNDTRARGYDHPIWIMEGFAYLYGTSIQAGDSFYPRHNMKLPMMQDVIRTGKTIPWATLFRMNIAAYNGGPNNLLTTATGEYIFEYIYERGLLKKFYDEYCRRALALRNPEVVRPGDTWHFPRGGGEASQQAIEAVFGKPMATVERDWREWVLKQRYSPWDEPLAFTPPAAVFGGRALDLTGITFNVLRPDNNVQGSVFWRRKGDATFESVPVEPAGEDGYKATLPESATAGPFEYYIQMQLASNAPVCLPKDGPRKPFGAVPDLTPPTAVPDLTAAAKSYRVTLRWKPATDDRGIGGYKVYRGTADKFSPDGKALVGETKGAAAEFADNAPVPPKQSAWYAVRAVDVVGREGEPLYLKVDVPAPEPPDNPLVLKASPASKAVALTWSGELEPNVTALEIYRGEGKAGPLQKIGETTELKTNRYLDKDAKFGTQYRYAVRPRSREGLVGEYSAPAVGEPLRYLKRINCGGPEVPSSDGVAWEPDAGKGNAALRTSGTSTWTAPDPVKDSSTFKNIYQTERWAKQRINYVFDVDVDPGRYEVVLYFAETTANFFGKGKRTFDILLNGEKVAEKVDIFTQAGGPMIPWQFRKIIDVTGRKLSVIVQAAPTGPAIKGIEIRGLEPQR